MKNKENYTNEANRIQFIHRSYKREAYKSLIKETNRRDRHKSSWKTIKFPSRVNLIEDPNQSLKYFSMAYKYYKKGYNVNYDLSNVINFSPESIAVFAASIQSDNFTQERESNGNSPKNHIVNRVFGESGFYDHVNVIGRKPVPKSAKLLHKVTNNKVETEIAKKTCRFIKDKLNLKYVDDTDSFYTILIEAMQNTNNHASADDNIEYDWWLYTYVDKRKKVVHFSFLDIGVGIFKSAPVSLAKSVFRKLTGTDKKNIELVDDLLAGKIESRTLRKDRGKGIPQIYEMSKDDMIKDFYIMSNDIMINTKTDVHTELKQDFMGTLYYWTIKI